MNKQRAPERLLHDAVVVVPGIMGSALRDVENNAPLWGVRRLFQYSARMHGQRLRALAVTDAERAGRTGRVEATGVLNVADWLPGLGAVQPYNDVISRLRRDALHRAAVLAFPYDWRLSVEYNGALLARAARRHLDAWRTRAVHRRYLSEHPEAGPAQLVFVAHSMGGLLAREVLHRGDMSGDVRAVMTIGTPFGGSVKAAVMINSGKGAPLPLPSAVLQEVTPTMPGLYDLLPAYRACREGADMRVPDVEDIVALGGRRDLAQAAVDWRSSRSDTLLPGHVMVVGMGQGTWQSYRLEAGIALPRKYMFRRGKDDRVILDGDGRPSREDRKGDGTVYLFAAHLPGSDARPIPVYQEHGALIRSEGVIDMACGMLRGLRHRDELGSMLGDGEFELRTPEWVDPNTPLTVEVSGVGRGAEVECVVREVSGLDEVRYPRSRPVPGTPGTWTAACLLDRPGLYEVEVLGGVEPMRRLVPVLAAEKHD